jgi:hypothetical protein
MPESSGAMRPKPRLVCVVESFLLKSSARARRVYPGRREFVFPCEGSLAILRDWCANICDVTGHPAMHERLLATLTSRTTRIPAMVKGGSWATGVSFSRVVGWALRHVAEESVGNRLESVRSGSQPGRIAERSRRSGRALAGPAPVLP